MAVFETHVQADHVSGLPALVERTGATAYLPAGAGVEFEHVALADGEVVELGNTLVTAIATPGHAPAHHAYAVADRRRGSEEPWLVFSGDSLLIGDVGRPDLHVAGDARGQARLLHASLRRLLELPDHVVVYPSHYGGSVCGRGLSGNPVSSIGFERAHNPHARARRPGRVRRRARSPTCRPGRPSRSGSSPPTAPARSARPHDAPVRLGLRANAAPVRAARRPERARRRRWSGSSEACCRSSASRTSASRSTAAILAFVVAFGAAKALTNLAAGDLAERLGRKRLLVAGWLVALPVPLLIGLAPSWWFIVAANLLLGVNQGLAWSMTVVMKIDLAGPRRRGLALGLNEAAGYLGVAAAAFATGALAASYAPRTVVWVGAAADRRRSACWSACSPCATPAPTSRSSSAHHGDAARAREPAQRVRAREPARPGPARLQPGGARQQPQRRARLGPRAALPGRPRRRACARSRSSPPPTRSSGAPASSLTGWLSDHIGRKPLITAGMLVQAGALGLLVAGDGAFAPSLAAAVLLGVGTAMVYPTLIAAVSDASQPRDRARVVGVYRFWRDFGFVARRPDRRHRRRRRLPADGDRDRRRAHRRQRPRRRRDLLAAAARAPTRPRPLIDVREPTFETRDPTNKRKTDSRRRHVSTPTATNQEEG